MPDEVDRYCVRMLGDCAAARKAAEAARAAGGEDQAAVLRAAVEACRRVAPDRPAVPEGAGSGLATAVAAELATAADRLPAPDREALALRHLTGRSYEEIAAATGTPAADVARLLAGARLNLRAALRDTPRRAAACPEHDRALRTIAARQDGEAVPETDDEWLIDHLAICPECARDHAALLEAAACYGAWAAGEDAASAGAA